MIQKTAAEKQALKDAKKACKAATNAEKLKWERIKEEREKAPKYEFIDRSDKPFEGERVLESDYPIHYGYLYVVKLQDGTYQVYNSMMFKGYPRSVIADYNRYLAENNNLAVEVLNCNIFARRKEIK